MLSYLPWQLCLDDFIILGCLPFVRTGWPKRIVLNGVNRKVKASPCDNSRNPCVEYTQELM